MEKEKQTLNLFQKLQKARVELQEMNLKKSGQNKFAGFKYFELSDFLPAINVICNNIGLFTAISFTNEYATLRIYDCDDMEKFIEFNSPMREIEQKGCNAIQSLGSIETYSRRYLFLTAFEIVENDFSDAIVGKETNNNKKQIKPQDELTNKIKLLIKQYSNISKISIKEICNDLMLRYSFEKMENLTDDIKKEICNDVLNRIAKCTK